MGRRLESPCKKSMDIGEVTVDRDRDRRARHEPRQHPVEHSALVQLRVKTRVQGSCKAGGAAGSRGVGHPRGGSHIDGDSYNVLPEDYASNCRLTQ